VLVQFPITFQPLNLLDVINHEKLISVEPSALFKVLGRGAHKLKHKTTLQTSA
jgi:hypothetical protein